MNAKSESESAAAETRCGEVWIPDVAVIAHIVCDRKLTTRHGKHTGWHIWHDPATGRPSVKWGTAKGDAGWLPSGRGEGEPQ